jgi:hypothetical protein
MATLWDDPTPTPPRNTDPFTSIAAAASVKESTIVKTYVRILRYLDRYGSATLEGLVTYVTGFPDTRSPSGTRTRVSVLVDFGLVEWTGRTAKGSSNRRMKLWRITDRGRLALEKREGLS